MPVHKAAVDASIDGDAPIAGGNVCVGASGEEDTADVGVAVESGSNLEKTEEEDAVKMDSAVGVVLRLGGRAAFHSSCRLARPSSC